MSVAAASVPSLRQLTLLHARYQLIETLRVPIAVIGSLVFPALALLFFVVPQRAVAEDPVIATQAVISLAVFAVMSNALFNFGLTIAESREKPWDPYLRTLPAPGLARVLAQILSTGTLGLVAVLPVIVIGALFTAAEATVLAVLAGLVALAIGALPFMLIGTAIGYGLPFKAAIAVIQILMFGLAFIGGLFLPPILFPDWLDTISKFTPSRQARELVIWAVEGGTLEWWVWVGILVWTAVSLAAALLLFRRDEGRRYR
ncbi:ABC transporter permease [Microbacterium sp. M3]|uniref:ABC transporter permease n=1 Tax=Microbacterium arthrosphaerae TaxID=792652 RepID=A0ABU4GW71_9MICO|nr:MULTISPECIES: ABC transporter permease [Microbacterium]MDW4571308.1 ABC transporter permease [Microbacterium arthrosphaerae]MDW7605163.1 ABC transporter permease [Microbacterium sp. M3]